MTRPPSRLTTQEREVAALIAASRTTQQVAAYLGVSRVRVQHVIASLAAKIEADLSGDLRVSIALWWRDRAA